MQTMNVNNQDFTVIHLLGKGKGGYSYLVTDENNQYVLKQIHHEPCEYYQFGNKLESERNDYTRLKETGIRMPELIDIDVTQERILKEYIEGPTIYELVLKDAMKCDYIEQVQDMCHKLYARNLNIDYFPTNFVAQEGLIYYIDYECNAYMEQWNFENWGIQYWSKTDVFQEYVHNLKS